MTPCKGAIVRNYFKALWLALKGDIELLEDEFYIPNRAWGAVPREYVGRIRRMLSEAAKIKAQHDSAVAAARTLTTRFGRSDD